MPGKRIYPDVGQEAFGEEVAIAHEDFNGAIEEHANEFKAAQTAMIAVVLAVLEGRLLQGEADGMLASVSDDLKARSLAWVERVVPEAMLDGARDALRALGASERDYEPLGSVGVRALLSLAIEGLVEDLAEATDRITLDAKRAIREIAAVSLEKSIATGEAPRTSARDMTEALEERGVGFTDKSGKRWDTKNYSTMVLQTRLADVANTGHIATASELGSSAVAVFDGGPGDVDEPCKRANGQTWSLSYAMAHKIEHPRCRRSFAAKPSTYDGEIDRD